MPSLGVNGSAGQTDSAWLNRERIVTFSLVAATLLALYICYLIVQPFIPTLTVALALAVSTHKPYQWLLHRLRNANWAAGVAVLLAACVLIIPLALLITYMTQEIRVSLRDLQGGSTWNEWRAGLYDKPLLGDLLRWADANLDLESQLTALAQNLAGQAGGLLRGSVSVLTQLVMTLFVLFFLYRDGRGALRTVRGLVPLSDREASRMFTRIANTILATVNGSITVALVQALIAGVMYTLLGIPAALLWSAATFVMALIPMFGTFLIWGPIAVYLALTGSWIKALILIGWGVLAISTIDNILYPYLVGDRLRLHTVPTFFAILGGIELFGPAGLILGPMTLAITLGLLEVWRSRTADDRPDGGPHGHST
ncbi:MAG: AI-2E family transporter, partial [Bryobacteraceae bacterium]